MSDENQPKQNNQQFLLGLFGGIAAIAVIGLIILGVAFINLSKKDGQVAGTIENPPAGQQTTGQSAPQGVLATAPGLTTFYELPDAQICQEDGKPVVFLFSTTWCPHCQWVKDTFDNLVKEYVAAGKIKAYHWELDTNDNTLTDAKETQIPAEHSAIYQQFNPQGSIPTFVMGCKYFRTGNGHERANDLVAEKAELQAAIEALLK